MMSLWDALRMNMMISYQELVRTFPKTSIICSPMTSLKTSIKTITYLSDIGCLEIHGASLLPA